MAGHYVMALAEGAKYSSYKEFQSALKTFCRQTDSIFTVRDCKSIETFNARRLYVDRFPTHLKYKYVKVACERYGQPRHEGKGLRNKGSKKAGCGAHVALTARKSDKESYLYVMRLEPKHSNQCEIRKKQRRFMRIRKRRYQKKVQPPDTDDDSSEVPVPPPSDQNAAPNTRVTVTVKPEPLDDDDDYEEYNYPVKPVVVYSDDETEEQKPVPIFHLNETPIFPTDGSALTPGAPAQTTKYTEILNVNADTCESLESCEDDKPPEADEEEPCEDIKPLPLADKPSLRALLLPAMALNFQRVIQTET